MTSNPLPAIIVNDSTLRDGGALLSHGDRMEIARALELAGVDEIEFDVSSGSGAAVDAAAIGAALCRSRPTISGPATKGFINAAIRTGFDAVYLSLPLSVSRGGRTNLLAGIKRVVGYAAERGLAVALSGEDASRSDLDLVCDVMSAAEMAGAHRFRYADTMGVLHPIRTRCVFRQLCAETDLELEFRGHDHFGLAVVNTLAAIQGGATHISVSVAGTDLETRPARLAGINDAIRLLAVHHTHIDVPQLRVLAALVAARMPGLTAQKALVPRQNPWTWSPSGMNNDADGRDYARW